ncbi:hypothetical protein B0I35DRAFT_173121 [Stachybotrys elegans]|uniref:Tetratricopeptide repeat protein 1 n=1 Tax=Stachybotrys elegans TaxID=80388 RepID=A0A8K0SUE2_9HYPO|nr:hypothetical protein B0I35DRAFT_173121 [Stachybotrys elegans]
MGGTDDVESKVEPPKDRASAEPTPDKQEEPETLLQESNTAKAEANTLFASKDYENALSRYDDALLSCPKYLHYPRAVLHSNVAACHLQLQDWEPAIKAATAAIDALAKIDGHGDAKEQVKPDTKEDVEEEIVSSGAAKAAPVPPPPTTTAAAASSDDILRIRTKALLRRARARSEAGGWSNLGGAEEDYRALSQMPGLTPADARTVRTQLRDLPPRTKAAQEAEMSEMWGKLRQLGDGILKPFGLSTNNFQMVKDEATGGYSMNFKQGGGKDA